jgi:hypothetical protein
MSRHGSQSSFDLSAPMPAKSDDQIKTEKILAEYQRENPEPEPSGRQVVTLQMRERMRQQRKRNDRGEDDDGSWVPCGPRPKELT